ncbi:omega-hydroxypalmitate O-feruloyl transferase-like [Rhododendron vialii]|uniref:omega-hydroxypalmitate O-feruloyl transferase-like n=1 Tax=Rhododendron vialii TaxID=182163 RepID=UPI00265EB44B|nr:omega-hydroxypalmitate O-feruloyl transferase-like [Rhododendron vialii]
MSISNGNLSEITVERGEPTLVPPAAEDTNNKGSLYFLSNLDINFQGKARTVYCFNPSDHNGGGHGDDEVLVGVIKNALSKALVHYYPVAGRLAMESDGRPVVDCTGEGAVFVEAKADCCVEEIGNDTVAMEKLVYDTPDAKGLLEVPPLTAQVTKFKNGGFVLGICVNHFVFDGVTAMDFINHWGEIARGLPLKVSPFLDRSILRARNPPQIEFPHTEFSEIEDISNTSDLYTEEMVYESFSFDLDKLEKLKMAATKDGGLIKCSTFEALSAFIWRSRTQALKLHHYQKIKLLLVVDGRSRFDPPLPEHYFGNGVVFTSAHSTAGELTEKPLSFAVELVREAIQRVTDRYMKSAIDYLEVNGGNVSMNATLIISSWTRLSFETTDFGWGQPYLAGRTSLPGKELVLFLSHPTDKKSINVLISFPTSSMKIFQKLMHI